MHFHKKAQTVGYRYYMTLHLGICRGAIDALKEIVVGERTAWKGNKTDAGEFGINAGNLYGGDKGEGGVDGTAELLLGKKDQTISSKIRGWLGGLVPSFRGCTTLFFDGLVCSLNAYPKAWKIKVHRSLSGWDGDPWYPEKARISAHVGTDTTEEKRPIFGKMGKILRYETIKNENKLMVDAMNPAHIVYQVCTDREWGRGIPRELIDDEYFRVAADTLYDEGFGMCISWSRTDSVDSFVQSVMDHIGATLYVDKQTGKMRLKLIRGDYYRDDVPLFDVNSGLLSIEESSASVAAETINEVIVKYHSPIDDQDYSVREQNNASIQMSGAVYSQTKEYPGIPWSSLAKRVAKRDLKFSTLPLRTFSIKCDRRAWHIQPGDVMRIKDESREQVDIVIRVGQVEDGTLTNGTISIQAVEDVFIMPKHASPSQGSLFTEPSRNPIPTEFFSYEIPYANLNRLMDKADFNVIGHDSGFYGMAARKNTPMSMGYDIFIRPEGGVSQDSGGRGSYNPVGSLSGTISYMDETMMLTNTTMEEEMEFPCAVYIGTEIAMIEKKERSDSGVYVYHIKRGIYDTIPAQHNKGDYVWFYEDDIGTDFTERVGGDVIYGKCLPYTLSYGHVDPDLVEEQSVAMNWRFSRPYAPGHVFMNGTKRWFNMGEVSRMNPVLTISWNHRDRLSQEDKMIHHDIGDIGPEPNSRYLIKVFNDKDELIRQEDNINAKEWKYLWAQAVSDLKIEVLNEDVNYPIKICLWTKREELESWQYYQMLVMVKDVKFYLETAQASQQMASEASFDNVDTLSTASTSMQTASLTDVDNVDTLYAADVSMVVNQTASIVEQIDFQAMEAPYVTQIEDGFSDKELGSRVVSFAARPSDRLTDEAELWTNLVEAVEQKDGDTGKTKMVAVDKGEWQSSGACEWTPWGVCAQDIGYLDDHIIMDETSIDDDVAPDIHAGDIAVIDKEIIRIDRVEGNKVFIGRGTADTIPSRHYANSVVWMFKRRHGIDSKVYGDDDYVGIKMRPVSHTPVQLPLKDIDTSVIKMAKRYSRPYPPGLMMIDDKPWFNQAQGVDATGAPRNVLVTWRHRNRLSQSINLVDWWHDDIDPEAGVKYLVNVGYNDPSTEKPVVIRTETVDATEWTYRKEWIIPDGMTVGKALSQASRTQAWITVFAIRDGETSWHGYKMNIVLPSYQPGSGEKPNVPSDNPGGNGGGDKPNAPGTDRPSDNPGAGHGNNPGEKPGNVPYLPGTGGSGGTGSGSNKPTNPNDPKLPDVPPGPDPVLPDPTLPEQPEYHDPNKDDEKDKKLTPWSRNYDHRWAAELDKTL